MNKPELIIFDLGRVLIDFDFKKFTHKVKKHTSLSEAEIKQYFVTTPLWDAFERGTVSPRAFFKKVSWELRLKDLTFEDFTLIWNDIFTVMPESVAILKKLKGHYRLALLSNVNQMHYEHVMASHPFLSWFDHPIASYAIGLRKPERAIYLKALQISGNVPAGKAMFFDDVEEHVAAARQVGIRAHQFKDAKQLMKDLEGILP